MSFSKKKKEVGAERDPSKGPFHGAISRASSAFAFVALSAAFAFVVLGLQAVEPEKNLSAAGSDITGEAFGLEPEAPVKGMDIKLTRRDETPAEGRYSIKWFLNGHPVEGYGKSVFPGLGLKKGDVVAVKVEDPKRGIAYEKSVRVGNSPPIFKGVEFKPLPLEETQDLVVLARPFDPDGDPVSVSYTWLVNEKSVTGHAGPILEESHFRPGDEIRAVVTVSDGERPLSLVSAPVLVAGASL